MYEQINYVRRTGPVTTSIPQRSFETDKIYARVIWNNNATLNGQYNNNNNNNNLILYYIIGI